MKIVVLDGHTLNPGDLSWDGLTALGDCDFHGRSAPAEVVPRSAGADVVVTNKVPLDRNAIESLDRLRLIAVSATGYNMVDVVAARERGVAVRNVPEYGTTAVAQHTIALLLELANRVGHHARTVADRWPASADFAYWDGSLVELAGMTIGIVGYGRIGAAVARIARAMGMDVLATSRQPRDAAGVRFVDLATLFRQSDVVSLHCPLTPETRELVNASRLATMKPSAFLLNTSRGGLVNEHDLAAALNAGTISGAGLDVLTTEPPRPDNPLLRAMNCVITPHIAWAARTARERLLHETVLNVKAFKDGQPRNVVNPR